MGKETTICWDCKNATGGCSWADSLEPVEGWNATKAGPSNSKPYTTYTVHACPLFIQDAIDGGLKRIGECKNEKCKTTEKDATGHAWDSYYYRSSAIKSLRR